MPCLLISVAIGVWVALQNASGYILGQVPLALLAAGLGDDQVQLGEITDKLNVPVLAYGLRTDFQGEPFEGSKYLLSWADNLKELKAICFCGSKATMVIRLDGDGNAITQGSQVEIGGNDRYVSMCRKHFKENFFRQTLVPQHHLPLEFVDTGD